MARNKSRIVVKMKYVEGGKIREGFECGRREETRMLEEGEDVGERYRLVSGASLQQAAKVA